MQKKKNNFLRVFLCFLTVVLLLAFSVVPCFAVYDNDTNRPSDNPPWYGENDLNTLLRVIDYGPVFNSDNVFAELAFDYYDDLYEWGFLPCYVCAISVDLINGDVELFYPSGFTDCTTTMAVGADNTVANVIISGVDRNVVPCVLSADASSNGYPVVTVSKIPTASGASFGRSNAQHCFYYRSIVNGVPTDFAVVSAENDAFVDASPGNYNVAYARLMIDFGNFLRGNLDGDIIVEEVVNETIVSEEIDVGSFLTSYMQAGRILFDGWFGFEIFGINVASTLISILIVAIVIWIVKHLRGD